MTNVNDGHESKEIRVRHNDSDAEIDRNRTLRWIVLIVSVLTAITIPTFLLGYIASILLPFGGAASLASLIGFSLGLAGFMWILPKRFIVTVGQVRAFVTLNPLLAFFGIEGSPNVIYGPGYSISFPWEQRMKKGNISLDIITLNWEEEVPGKSTKLLATGSYQFKVDITMADRFIGVDDSTIRGGAIDRIKSRISNTLATKGADAAKRNIGKLNGDLGTYFGIETDEPTKDVSDFEESYGIHSVKVTIAGIDLPPHVQKTRDAVDEAQQVLKGVAAMYGMSPKHLKESVENGEIPREEYNNMLDRFAATSENATMNIQAYKVDGLDRAARVFGEAFGEMLMRRN